MSDDLGVYIAKLGADITGLRQGLLEGRTQFAGFQQVIETGAAKIKSVLAFAGITLGFGVLISQAKEFGRAILEEGGKVEVLRASADAIANYYGMSGSAVDFYIKKLKEKGITEANALQATTSFLKAGISVEKLPQLAEAAKVLGPSMAMPLQEAFDSMVSGIVKGTPKQLAEMVPGIREVLQSMSSETKKLLDSNIISGTEKSEILLNAALAMADKLKGSVDNISDSYFAKLNEYKVKVAEAKEVLFEFVKTVSLSAMGQQVTSWQELYHWVVNNRQELANLAAIISVWIEKGILSIKTIINLAAAHKELLLVLLEIWGTMKVVKWFAITEGAAAAGVAVAGLTGKIAALRLALAGPWGLVIAVSLVGLYQVYKQIEDIQKQKEKIGRDTAAANLKDLAAAKAQRGEKLTDAEMAALISPEQRAAAAAMPQITEEDAAAQASRAAAQGKKEHELPPGAGKAGKEEDLLGAYQKMLEQERQAEIQASQSSLDLLKATNEQKKAELEKALAEGLLDGQTYYQRLQELQQGETAAALALIEQKRQAQLAAHQEALADLARQDLSPEMRAYREYQELQKNRQVLSQLDAEAARTRLEGETKITNELKRQVEVQKQYQEKTADLNLETATLLGAISEQEAVLQKLYLDWQRAKAEAVKAGGYTPEYAAALDANFRAKQFDASPLGQQIKSVSQIFTSGFGDLITTLSKGGVKISAALEQLGQKLQQDVLKLFVDDLGKAISQGLKALLAQVLGSAAPSGGGGGGGGFFSWLGGLFGGGGGEFSGYGVTGADAMGHAYSHGVRLALARGGIITSPTLFPMAGGMGLMGEAGPEGVLPLERIGSSLGVKALFPPGNVTVVNNLGVEAEPTVSQDDNGWRIVLDKLQDAVTHKDLSSIYGLSRTTIGR